MGATFRIDHDYDEISESPLSWDGSSVIVLRPYNDAHENVQGPAEGVLEAVRAAQEFGQDSLEAGLKHARRNGIEAHAVSYQGAVQGDRLEGIFVGPEDTLEAWKQYRRGEVYYVTLQRETVWTSDTGEKRTTWETVDAIGDCYLTDAYTRLDVARLYFDLEGKEIVK